ncbi:MAG: Crp/Fnr family transcriptional regulator [Oscillospiraceae bacterium]|nr:Crp/Fnr family transcriptional regulator [Oscillospiraceae bacterium]
MKLEEIFLFDGVDSSDKARMISCFKIQRRKYKPGEIICDFEEKRDRVGIILSGSVSLVRIDASGNRIVIEDLSENDVFGEMFALADDAPHGIFAECEKKCEVAFVAYSQISKRCENACLCHTTVVENMFRVVTKKTKRLSERIEVLSNKSIRDKLLCLFSMYSQREGKPSFELPFSLSYLAEYICADRSAMMREIKHMSDDGLIKNDKRRIEMLI